MKENFYETDSDWLHYESSGARHSYPSPGSLGVQPMVRDPYAPIRNLWEQFKLEFLAVPIMNDEKSSRSSSYTDIQDEFEASFKQRRPLDR